MKWETKLTIWNETSLSPLSSSTSSDLFFWTFSRIRVCRRVNPSRGSQRKNFASFLAPFFLFWRHSFSFGVIFSLLVPLFLFSFLFVPFLFWYILVMTWFFLILSIHHSSVPLFPLVLITCRCSIENGATFLYHFSRSLSALTPTHTNCHSWPPVGNKRAVFSFFLSFLSFSFLSPVSLSCFYSFVESDHNKSTNHRPSFSLPTHANRRKVTVTSNDVFSFCWTLFIHVKANFSAISDDLVNSYHLLLACIDFCYSNALVAENAKELLNPSFPGQYHFWYLQNWSQKISGLLSNSLSTSLIRRGN